MTLNFVTETETIELQYSPEFSALIEAQQQVELAKAEVVKAQDEFLRAATQAGRSELAASQALANKTATDVNLAQTLAALNSAVGIVFGQATGIGGVLPTARIRANMRNLPPQFSFSRSGAGATFFDRNLNLVEASSNQLRFDHDPESGQPIGVSISGGYTEYIRRNTEFENAAWTRSGVDVSVSGGNFGAFSWRTIIPTTENIVHRVRQTNDFQTSISVAYAKVIVEPAGYNFCTIFLNGSGVRFTRTFNLIDGTVSNPFNNQTNTLKVKSTRLRNGAWLLEIGASVTGANLFTNISICVAESAGSGHTDSGQAFPGNGTSGIRVLVCSVCFEDLPIVINRGDFAHAIQPDVLSMNLANYNRHEWTVIIRSRVNTIPLQILFNFFGSVIANRLVLSGSGFLSNFINNSVSPASLQSGTSGIGNFDIYCISFNAGRVAISRNGSIPLVMNAQTPTVQNIDFSPVIANASKHIHTFQYIPKALTDAQVQVRSNPNLFFGIENVDVALNTDLEDSAFTSVNAIQRLPSRTDMPFYGNGTNQTYTFQLNYDCEVQDVFTTGSTFTRPTPGTVIPRGTNITVTHNAPVGTVMILAFLPIIQ